MKKDSLVFIGRKMADSAYRYYTVYIVDSGKQIEIPKSGLFQDIVARVRRQLGISDPVHKVEYAIRFTEFKKYINARWTLTKYGYVIPRTEERILLKKNPDLVTHRYSAKTVISKQYINQILNGEEVVPDVVNHSIKVEEHLPFRHTMNELEKNQRILKGMRYAGKNVYVNNAGCFVSGKVLGYSDYNNDGNFKFAVVVKNQDGSAKIVMAKEIYEASLSYKLVCLY